MMKKNFMVLLAIITIGYGFGFPFCSPAGAILAFPSAEGLGRDSVGGRGGAIIHVTNLNDTGSGSLRAAVTASGPRVVVFDVSGNINLTSAVLTINNPYLTIAGQTSPGGVAVSGKQFNVATHDVIIRHMRFRSGGHEYDGDDSDGDSFSLWGQAWGGNPVYNIMIDHCSFTWGTDETFAVTGGATATTIQKSLIGHGLNHAKSATTSHSKGLMISGKYGYDTKISLYRNYITASNDRNPLFWNAFGRYSGDTKESSYVMVVDVRNNVLYNWYHGNRPMVGGWRNSVNWIENWSKEGPISNRLNAMMSQGYTSPGTPYPSIYIRNSHGISKTGEEFADGDVDEWAVANDYTNNFANIGWKKTTEFSVSVPINAETMNSALASSIVATAGATVPVIDSVDQAIINSYAAGTGNYPDTVKYPGDWPKYSTPAPPADTDRDGIPNAWEISKGLNPDSADSNNYFLDNNYTNIEIYLNELAGDFTATGVKPLIKNIIVK